MLLLLLLIKVLGHWGTELESKSCGGTSRSLIEIGMQTKKLSRKKYLVKIIKPSLSSGIVTPKSEGLSFNFQSLSQQQLNHEADIKLFSYAHYEFILESILFK